MDYHLRQPALTHPAPHSKQLLLGLLRRLYKVVGYVGLAFIRKLSSTTRDATWRTGIHNIMIIAPTTKGGLKVKMPKSRR